MAQPTKQPTSENEEKDWKSKGHRALIINIIFFIVLLGCIFLIPLTGLLTTGIIIAVVFIASVLYIYLF